MRTHDPESGTYDPGPRDPAPRTRDYAPEFGTMPMTSRSTTKDIEPGTPEEIPST